MSSRIHQPPRPSHPVAAHAPAPHAPAAPASAPTAPAAASGQSAFVATPAARPSAPVASAASPESFTGKLTATFSQGGVLHEGAELTAIQGKVYFDGQEVGTVGQRWPDGSIDLKIEGQVVSGTEPQKGPAQPRPTEVDSLGTGAHLTAAQLVSQQSKIDTIVAVVPLADQAKVRAFLQGQASAASVDSAFQQVMEAAKTPGAKAFSLKLDGAPVPVPSKAPVAASKKKGHATLPPPKVATRPGPSLTVGASMTVGADFSVNGKPLPCDKELHAATSTVQLSDDAKRGALAQVGVSPQWLQAASSAELQAAAAQLAAAQHTPGPHTLTLPAAHHTSTVQEYDKLHHHPLMSRKTVAVAAGPVAFTVGAGGEINGQPSKLSQALAAFIEKETKPWPEGAPETYVKPQCKPTASPTTVAEGSTRQGKIDTVLAVVPEAQRAAVAARLESPGGVSDASLDQAFRAVLDARSSPGAKTLQLSLASAQKGVAPLAVSAPLTVSADGKVNGAKLPADLEAQLSSELAHVPAEFKDQTLREAGLPDAWLKAASPLEKDYALAKLREAALTPGDHQLDFSLDVAPPPKKVLPGKHAAPAKHPVAGKKGVAVPAAAPVAAKVHINGKLTLHVTDDGKVNGKPLACDTALSTMLAMERLPLGEKRQMVASLGFDKTAQRVLSSPEATNILFRAAMATATPGDKSLTVNVGGEGYQLCLKVGDKGELLGAGAAKIPPPPPEPDFWDNVISTVVPVVCVVVGVVFPVLAPACSMVSGACAAYEGIKTGNYLGAAIGMLGAAGGALTVFGGASNAALAGELTSAATLANRAEAIVSGVQSGDVAGLFKAATSFAQGAGASASTVDALTTASRVVTIGTAISKGDAAGALNGVVGWIDQSQTTNATLQQVAQVVTFGQALAKGDPKALATVAGSLGLSQGTMDNLASAAKVVAVGQALSRNDFAGAVAAATAAGASQQVIDDLTQVGKVVTLGKALQAGDFNAALAGAKAFGAPESTIAALTRVGQVATMGQALAKGDVSTALSSAQQLGLSQGTASELSRLNQVAAVGQALARGDFAAAIAAAKAAGASATVLSELSTVGQAVTTGRALAAGDVAGALAGAKALGAPQGVVAALTTANQVATVGQALAKGDVSGALAAEAGLGLSASTITNLTTLGHAAELGQALAKGDFAAAISAARAGGATAGTLAELTRLGQTVTAGKAIASGDLKGAAAGLAALGAPEGVVTALTQGSQLAAFGAQLAKGDAAALSTAASAMGLSERAQGELKALQQGAQVGQKLASGDFAGALAAATAAGASPATVAELKRVALAVSVGKAVAIGDVSGAQSAASALGASPAVTTALGKLNQAMLFGTALATTNPTQLVAAGAALGISQGTLEELATLQKGAAIGQQLASGDFAGAAEAAKALKLSAPAVAELSTLEQTMAAATDTVVDKSSVSGAPRSVDELVADATAAAESPSPAAPVTYVVAAGDNLSKIALKQLGSASRWPELYEYNRASIGSDPNKLKQGVQLTLPPADYKLSSAARNALITSAHIATPTAAPFAAGADTPAQTPAIAEANGLVESLGSPAELASLLSTANGAAVSYVEAFQAKTLERMVGGGATASGFVAGLEQRLVDARKSAAALNQQVLSGVPGARVAAARVAGRVEELEGYLAQLKSARSGLEVLEGMKKAAPLLSGFSAAMDAMESKTVTTAAGKSALALGQFMADAALDAAVENPVVMLADGSLKLMDPAVKAAMKALGYGDVISPTEKLALSTQLGGAIKNIVGLGESLFTRSADALAQMRSDNLAGKNGIIIQGYANLGELLAASRLLDFL